MTLGLARATIGRCPNCKEFIDLSVLECRFCRAFIDPKRAQEAAALQEKINREIATKNNARSLRYVMVDLGQDLLKILVGLLKHVHPHS